MSNSPYNSITINQNYIETFQNSNDDAVIVNEKVFITKGRTLNRKCPYKGCKLNYDKDTSMFVCPCHNSKFNMDGNCISGPACPANIRI